MFRRPLRAAWTWLRVFMNGREKEAMRCHRRQRIYQVHFATPAFLGGADQSALWRIPPFKALIRQWWRIVWWRSQQRPSIEALRDQESLWFGSSAENETGASRFRLRLDDWRGKTLNQMEFQKIGFGKVDHEEVGKKVSASLYLGYGPVTWQSGKAQLQRASALPVSDSRTLILAYPNGLDAAVEATMRLIGLFGCLGGRSRNGWGSLMIQEVDQQGDSRPLFDEAVLNESDQRARDWLRPWAVPWKDALDQDWCHALGRDEKGLLLWRTELKNRWENVLEQFAKVKIGMRTQFHFKGGGPHASLCDRQILAYPVTNHSLHAWGNKARSANQLLFKVLAVSDGFLGIIVHLPHSLPEPLKAALGQGPLENIRQREEKVWSKMHQYLDDVSKSSLVRLK